MIQVWIKSALINILSTKSDRLSRVGGVTYRRACRPARSSRAGISSCLPQLTPGSARSPSPPGLQPQLQDKTSFNSQTLRAPFLLKPLKLLFNAQDAYEKQKADPPLSLHDLIDWISSGVLTKPSQHHSSLSVCSQEIKALSIVMSLVMERHQNK